MASEAGGRHRAIDRYCDKRCCNRGTKSARGPGGGMSRFLWGPEEGLYKLSRQESQRSSEKTTRTRNVTQDDQFYLCNSPGRLVTGNWYFSLQETGKEGDFPVSQRVRSKPELEGLQVLNKCFVY